MKYIVFDIETKNTFADVGSRDPSLLDLALVGVYDSTEDTYLSYLEDELDQLWPRIEQADALIGFNSDHFDIPLLNKYYHGELEHIKSIDLLKTVFNTIGKRVGLDAIAEQTLGVRKSGHGLKAIEWWKNGEIEKVRNYCLDDVRVTHDLFKHIRDLGSIKYRDRRTKEIVEVELNTDEWDELESGKMTQSLPF